MFLELNMLLVFLGHTTFYSCRLAPFGFRCNALTLIYTHLCVNIVYRQMDTVSKEKCDWVGHHATCQRHDPSILDIIINYHVADIVAI